MIDLVGKRALVTGAGQRVGRAIAMALGEAGMHVAVHYRGSERGAAGTADAIRAAGGRADTFQADLSDRKQARRLVDECTARLGGLDLLVPSAASFERVRWDDVDDDAWDRTLELNLAAPFALAHQATPALRASGGSIVFITCSGTTAPFKNHTPYVVSKGALRQLMRVLSLELAPEVRVNAVAPGTVLPPEDMDPATVARIVARAPLQRVGAAADIADAVLYLARADFVTGHELVVDGGRSVAAVETFS